MGQKVNPHGLRVGIIKGWSSNWYASKEDFSDNLMEDQKIRKYIKNRLFLSNKEKGSMGAAQDELKSLLDARAKLKADYKAASAKAAEEQTEEDKAVIAGYEDTLKKNQEDAAAIRKEIEKETKKHSIFESAISHIDIERTNSRLKITVYTGKPGVMIGPKGANIEALKNDLCRDLKIKVKKNAAADGKKRTYASVDIDIEAIENPELDAQLVAENIADQLEKRIAFRRAMKNAIDKTMMAGAKGIKVQCSGRLAGADIARSEIHSRGTIPLQMLRADINYGFAEANTTYGKVGVKVWIYEGEILPTTRREGQRDNDRRGRKFDNKRPARRRNGGREGSDK